MYLTHLMQDTLNRRILYRQLIQNTKHREFMNRHTVWSLRDIFFWLQFRITGYLPGTVNGMVITNHSCKSHLILYLKTNTYSECP